jgi:aryl-alcohol dehydrogenase-like predicted oxidoreductase
VRLALDRGINFIDTADVYSLGESETLLGNALNGIREEIVLATKVRLPMGENFNRSGATRVNIMREVEGSLRRLQTDYIDLYQVHGWDSNTPLEETLRTLDDLVRHGKVRYIGLSNLMSWQAATAVMLQDRLGLEKYVTAQMYYSLVGRGLEYEFQSFAEYHNIGILVWSPLAGGFLAGKYSRNNPPPAGAASPTRVSSYRLTERWATVSLMGSRRWPLVTASALRAWRSLGWSAGQLSAA